MIEIAYILISCCLFIHLGLGDTICKIIRYNFVLFQCIKCLTFWSVLGYLIINTTNIITSVTIAFICAYIALWIDLLLSLIAQKYEKYYESMGTEKSQNNRSTKTNNNQDKKVKNG